MSLDPAIAARVMHAIDTMASHIPSPEGCGCAARKAAMVEQMRAWLLKSAENTE